MSILFLSMQGLRAEDAPSAAAPPTKKDWSFSELGLAPTQNGGRIKPLDSFVGEAVLYITGSRRFQGWEPMDLALSWMTNSRAWDEIPFVQVSREDVKRQLGLNEKRSRFSPVELIRGSALIQYAEKMGEPQPTTVQANDPTRVGKGDPRQEEVKQVIDRLGLYRSIASGDAWMIVPASDPHPWFGLSGAGGEKAGTEIRAQFAEMAKAYHVQDRAKFEQYAATTRTAVEKHLPAAIDLQSLSSKLKVEHLYNHARPFRWAWVGYMLAGLLWFFSMGVDSKAKPGLRRKWVLSAIFVTTAAALIHSSGIAMRCYIAGRAPVTNMYESVVWVFLGVMMFASIIYFLQRQAVVMAIGCAVATIGLIVGDAAPAILDPSINPLVPVLRSNLWLTVHVLTITLGYSAFALSLGIGNFALFQYMRKGSSALPPLNQLGYRAIQFGVVFLAAGTILGGVWADYSWGRFWGWDPKEVWALIALMAYIIILHARFVGWIAQFGFAVWTVVSFLTVMMAWYGVNFVLGVGLHSYGFASGGAGGMALFSAIQLAYIGVVLMVRWKRERAERTEVSLAKVSPA